VVGRVGIDSEEGEEGGDEEDASGGEGMVGGGTGLDG